MMTVGVTGAMVTLTGPARVRLISPFIVGEGAVVDGERLGGWAKGVLGHCLF